MAGNYRRFCRRVGLPEIPGGWGLLHCEDEHGAHVTAVTPDVGYVQLLVTGSDAKALGDLEIPPDKFPAIRQGWPDEWL